MLKKHLKKIVSLVLVTMMAIGMSITAIAAEPYQNELEAVMDTSLADSGQVTHYDTTTGEMLVEDGELLTFDEVAIPVPKGSADTPSERGIEIYLVRAGIKKTSGGEFTWYFKQIGYLPQEFGLYPNLTVREALEYVGIMSGMEKAEYQKQIDYYLEATGLSAHQKKKNRQLSGGMKRRVGLIQALLHNPSVLIVDEPTTGLDPEERIRIRNLLFDFSADRTVLFSTHVTEDLAATCNQLAVMKKGHFLYSGNMSELIEQAQGHVWKCRVSNENKAREVEQRYHVSAKQLTSDGLLMKIISSSHPDIECWPCEASLEDAYIYLSNIKT